MPPEKMSDVMLYATYADGHTEPVIIKELQDLTFNEAEKELEKVDFVKVVRCKDCKWHGKPGCAIEIVDDTDKPSDYDFCSFGERKER